MREKSVAIVGGGPAGLSAGIYLRKNGYRTHLFEHHTLPGGGVPTVLISGCNVARLICHPDGKQFAAA